MRNTTFVALLVCGLSGCGPDGPPVAAPVEPEMARAALRSTLEAWKAGRKPADMMATDPPVVAQDMDWTAGTRLVGYELLDDQPMDANLRANVKLTLHPTGGKETVKTVAYIVGTDPKLTVFRALE